MWETDYQYKKPNPTKFSAFDNYFFFFFSYGLVFGVWTVRASVLWMLSAYLVVSVMMCFTGCIATAHRTDDDLDHLDPGLPLRNVVQDPYSIDSTHEMCAR